MNITFFFRENYDKFLTQPGGGEKSALLLISNLIKKKKKARLVCFGNKNISTKLKFNDVEIPVVQYKVNKLSFFTITPFLFQYYNIVKKEAKNSDILHFYNVYLDPVAGLFKLLNNDKKIISTLNSYYYISPNFECRLFNKPKYKYNFIEKHIAFFDLIKENYSFFKAMLLVPLIPVLVIFSYINISLSKKIKNYACLSMVVKEIYELNGFSNITVIPNMLDSNISNKKRRKEKVVLYVGRIKRSKGVENLIKAFIKSDLIKQNYILKIVGDGNNLNLLKENYIHPNIIFVGNIPYKDIKEEYSRAELFVHPGLWPEPFGRTIFEAIQNNCKIIVSDIGAPKDIIKNKNLVFNHANLISLVNKLNNINKIKVLNKNILNEYTSKNITNKFIEVYNE
ncbi:MAG: glycosyltransferase family 4 protein [Candidatus Woesearchaeota archaeon]